MINVREAWTNYPATLLLKQVGGLMLSIHLKNFLLKSLSDNAGAKPRDVINKANPTAILAHFY